MSACDDQYFEKHELNSIVKDFESFYRKAVASKRTSIFHVDEVQSHRQNVVKLSKRFSSLQVIFFVIKCMYFNAHLTRILGVVVQA